MSRWLHIDRSAFRLAVVFALVIALGGVFAPGTAAAEEISGLQPVVVKYGHYSLSIDGVGIMTDESTGTIEIEKPVGATLEGAYLLTSVYSELDMTTVVSIEGIDVGWDLFADTNNDTGFNLFTDVTDILTSKLNGAPAGMITLSISEHASWQVEGNILAVIWNDPGQDVDTTIALFFGTQPDNGDPITFEMADPIDTSNSDLAATMSLGISFSYQSSGDSGQYTKVDVNGQRLTTSAGGQDDNQGIYDHFTLQTVGGTGDSTANPPDPYQLPTGDPRYDDELYDLMPFISNGDTQLTIKTEAQSSALENLFFAGFELIGIQLKAANTAPVTASDQSSVTVAEGQTATMTGTVSDPDDDELSLSASIGTVVDNGDGTWSWSYPTTDGPSDNQTVTITADDGVATGSATFDLAVLNVAPSMTSTYGPPGPIEAGVATSFGGTFTDPGIDDTHTATWDWGDGTTSAGTVSGNSASGSHVFATGGYYNVQLTITDDDGGTVTSTYSNITVIDRDAGWLTIAGDFQSPTGAWTERPSVSTLASIDVLAGYIGDSPTGRLTFTLGGSSRTSPALSLRATGFSQLVMGDDTAWLHGTGTLNGKRGYAFILTATDGPGMNANDGVRIRIWDTESLTVVYDNVSSAPLFTPATQPLKRGLVSIGGFGFR